MYDLLSIHSNGNVVVCCRDIEAVMKLGNINDNSLKEILDSELMSKYKDEKFKNSKLCKKCENNKIFL
jgi:radical SAM protein with 4Fe4S-binding SPASM domain